jgi:hypothetical protein
VRKVAGRFVQVAMVLLDALSAEVIQWATRFDEICTGWSATRKLSFAATWMGGAVKAALFKILPPGYCGP